MKKNSNLQFVSVTKYTCQDREAISTNVEILQALAEPSTKRYKWQMATELYIFSQGVTQMTMSL